MKQLSGKIKLRNFLEHFMTRRKYLFYFILFYFILFYF